MFQMLYATECVCCRLSEDDVDVESESVPLCAAVTDKRIRVAVSVSGSVLFFDTSRLAVAVNMESDPVIE